MPQPAKGARLFLRRRAGRPPVWVIKDSGQPERSTGTSDRREAEIALSEYIAHKNRQSGPANAEAMTVADVLGIYAEEKAPHAAAPERIAYAISALLPFWGALPVSAVKGATCRRYAATRGKAPGTIRRELGCLGAALKYCEMEGYLLNAPPVELPLKPETTQKALTRSEAAKLIRAARNRGAKHIARFILIGLYTGTRKEAILGLRLSGPSTVGGWFDLDAGLLYRKGEGQRSTNKRRPPAKLPRQLLAHARRWQSMGLVWAIEYRGARVASIKTAWRKTVEAADLGWKPTPHTLKHTAITWAIQGGASISDAAGFFGTSVDTIEKTYWHISPHYQQGAVGAIENRKERR